MSKSKAKKEQDLVELREQLDRATVAVFTSFSGLLVGDEQKLRQSIYDVGGEYHVAKKTLLKKVFSEKGHEALGIEEISQPISITFGFGDEVETAKVLADFRKEHENVQFLGGYLDGNLVNAATIEALAKLPSRQQLLGQFVRTIQAPLSGFVTVLQGNIRGLVTVLSAIKDQKSEA